MRPDADHHFVDALPKVARDIEDRGGETREVLSDHVAVNPHGRSELGFVDAERGDAAHCGDGERASIPEIIALLVGYTGSRHECGGGGETTLDAILDELAALELIDIGKGGDGGVGESGDGGVVGPG